MKTINYLKKLEFRKLFKNWKLGNYFKVKYDEIKREDMWPKGGHANHARVSPEGVTMLSCINRKSL